MISQFKSNGHFNGVQAEKVVLEQIKVEVKEIQIPIEKPVILY